MREADDIDQILAQIVRLGQRFGSVPEWCQAGYVQPVSRAKSASIRVSSNNLGFDMIVNELPFLQGKK